MISNLLYLAIACIGQTLLVDIRPYYDYTDNVRSQDPVGYIYDVCLPMHKMDKLFVKIPGKQLMDAPLNGALPVEFANLHARPYVDRNGRLAVTATANGIKAVNDKA